MESLLFETDSHFILRKGNHSLWCSRSTGRLAADLDDDEEGEEKEAELFLYEVQGLLGKIRLLSDSDWRLLLIRRATPIGNLPQGDLVYRVDEVAVLPLTTDSNLAEPTNQRRAKSKDVVDKLEKRLLEALTRMLNGSESFYFTYNGDLTNSTQRRIQENLITNAPLWQQADERFFWNKFMLADLLGENYKGAISDPWILPVVQGYVEIQKCPVASIVGHVPRVLAGFEANSLSRNEDISLFFQESEPRVYDWEERSSPGDGEREAEGERSSAVGRDGGSQESDLGETEEKDIPVMSSNEGTRRRAPLESTDSLGWTDVLTGDQPLLGESTMALEGEGTSPPLQAIRPGIAVEGSSPPSEGGTMAHTLDDATREDDDVMPRGSDPAAIPEQSLLDFCDNHFASDSASEMDGSDGLVGSEDMEEQGHSGVPEEEEEGQGEGHDIVEEVEEDEEAYPHVTFVIISRRSRHRAGTRYKRRGADISGAVANYVETEFITTVGTHSTSLVMVRGSVPILWSQPGYKYKPPPVVDKDQKSSTEALTHHFTEQLSMFKQVCVINTLNQSGSERRLSDAYEHHLLSLNCPDLKYVVFDFHHICRGSQQIGNVQILLDKIRNIIKQYRFCWLDSSQENPVLCLQNGVFRVNCLDCLDRTNVVQSYMAREVLLSMLLKLGLVNPECSLDGEAATLYNQIWANNGDAISMQYAGTAAMKGDLTRHGERKLAGVMKDGYNSAHRYLLNIFRDTYRQIVIDLMLGESPSEVLKEVLQDGGGDEPVEYPFGVGLSLEREEMVGRMVEVCRRQLYPYYNPDQVDGWALCEPAGMSFLPQSDFEENVVMLLYKERPELTVANYDISTGEITSFVRIPLEYVDKLEIGPLGNMLRNSRRPHFRLHYTFEKFRSSFFTFKTTAFVSVEEDNAILEDLAANLVKIGEHIAAVRTRIDRKRSPSHFGLVYLRLPKELVEELEIRKSRSKVLHEKVPSMEHPSYRDVHSDDELLDLRDSKAQHNTGSFLPEEDEDEDGDLLGSAGNDTNSRPRLLTQPVESGRRERRSSDEYVGPANGKHNLPLTQQLSVQSLLEVSHSAPSSRTSSPRQGRSSRVKQTQKDSASSIRSSSPSPERPSPQVRRRPLRAHAAAKEFFSDKGFSKLKQKVLSKISNINLATSDKDDDEVIETKRQDMWKKSQIDSIFIL